MEDYVELRRSGPKNILKNFDNLHPDLLLLNFLSSLSETRSLNFDAMDSVVEQIWPKSSGDKNSFEAGTCRFIGFLVVTSSRTLLLKLVAQQILLETTTGSRAMEFMSTKFEVDKFRENMERLDFCRKPISSEILL